MRKINLKQFLRILKGEDLEFRIDPFPFKALSSVTIEGIHLPYDLNFENCLFNSLTFENCRFSGDLQFDRCQIRQLNFKRCQIQNLSISNSSIDKFEIIHSSELRHLNMDGSDINLINIVDNPIFETISLGCENNVRNCRLFSNGSSDLNSFSTKVFICPQRFETIDIQNSTTDILHIGTFGEYARITVKDVFAEVVLIDQCASKSSKVNFQNISPLEYDISALHLVDTDFDPDIFHESAFIDYKVTKIHQEKVNVSELILA